MIKRGLLIIFIISNMYAILCGGLYFFQDNLIFHPQQLEKSYTFSFKNAFEEVWLDTPDGAKLNGLHFQVDDPKGVILYFHGNAGSLARWGEIVQFLVEKKYSVIVMDYRQYGKSTGELTESNLYEDSLLWYAFAKAQYPSTPIISYGRSLGTTFATYVTSKHQTEQLILETPFYSIVDEASSRFPFLPISKLLKYQFPTYTFVEDLKTKKVTVFHGTEDEVVSYEHGQKLFEKIALAKKEFITIPEGGHNNLIQFIEYNEGIDRILQD